MNVLILINKDEIVLSMYIDRRIDKVITTLLLTYKNKMLHMAQNDTTAVINPEHAVGANMKITYKLDTVQSLDCD